jgi:PAS domain S-box-containing protein
MPWLDARTVMISMLITDVLCNVVLIFLWIQNRNRYRGLSLWAAGFGLQAAGTLMIILRGTIPDWMSMTVSNTLIVAGMIMTVKGLERYVERSRLLYPGLLVISAFAAVSFYFVQFRPLLPARNLAISAATIAAALMGAALAGRKTRPELRRIVCPVAYVYGVLILICLVRIVRILAAPMRDYDFFQTGSFDTLILLFFQMVFAIMTYFLALIVNRRLIGDVRVQEEKFSKAFRSSPYAITMTRASDGLILEVNDGFEAISGYAYAEVVGKNSLNLHLWEKDEDRLAALEALKAGKAHGLEYRFRKKTGEPIVGLWSAEQIEIDGQPYVLSSISDITKRKKTEEALSESLQEKDLLMHELRHRVKNSLAVVSSLLSLSRDSAQEPGCRGALADLRSRIGSIASVYEQLDRTGRADAIHLRPYILDLAASLTKSYGPVDGRVGISTRLDDLALETRRALPLGLILNELIINAFKYAYPPPAAGEIKIALEVGPAGASLTVSDNGVGMAAGSSAGREGGTGLKLVDLLAGQIDARVSRPAGPGTTVVVSF